MWDWAIAWALHYPLQTVAVLAGLSIAIGWLLIPRLHEHSHHGHPRC